MDFDDIPETMLAEDDDTSQAPCNYPSRKLDMSGISRALRDQAKLNVLHSRNRGGRTLHPPIRSAPSTGRGAGSSPLTPLANPRRQGSSIASTTLPHAGHTKGKYSTNDSLPETVKTLPTPAIIEREKLIRSRPIRDLAFKDFIIDNSSEGTSPLVSLLVRTIASIHEEMMDFQLARIAAHAILHHPLRLLNYLQNTSAMSDFVISSLSTYPTPIVDPYTINPMNTPFLIPDDTLRLKIDHPLSLTDEDYRDILNYFVACFYPAHYDTLSTIIQDMNSLELENCAHEDGVLTTEFDQLLTTRPEYSPPEWVDLSLIIDISPHSTSVKKFDPMECIGMSQRDFVALPIDQMKQIAMAKLPQAMALISDTRTILTVLTALRATSRTNMASFLTPATFHRYLHPNKVDTLQFYCRLRLAPIRGKRNALWAATLGAILSHWLQVTLPLLLPRYTISLVFPPHLPNQSQYPITSPQLIPETAALDPYVSEVQKDQSDHVVQMDFWILTNCPNLDKFLPRQYEDTLDGDQRKYVSDLSRAAMRFSNQEQIPTDMEVCVILVGSVSRDCNQRILAELKDRIPGMAPLVGNIYVSWITLRTNLDHASIMAKCIMAPLAYAKTTRDLFRISPLISDSYLVT
jgi:hypothetical protein